MARGNAAWGIDIGQSALKALRCTLDNDGKTVRAEAFDYIEYPKILTQPDADPEALIRDALKEFLSRNSVRGDKVAISVSGQSGLARFIKLPPVEQKKIPQIVKYEAKQQIPFDLDDVIWDYQALPSPEPEDALLETEVGLFAMKREHVFRAIRPLDDAGVELDFVQLAPISIYNAATYGIITDIPTPEEFDPDNPPPWTMVLSMGTETTDLVLTNGYRVWQRSIPLGGNHFTKQLTKEMKLTFAQAEQLKRNSREAENAKEIFQAMRPVFNDLVTEVQRSIGYFKSIERDADVTKGVAMGTTVKLPGLQQFLTKNLGFPVEKVSKYRNLEGSEVISLPAFEENVPSFAVCYGLVLQGLGLAKLATNLVPRELVVARMIRRKKPWALSAVAVVLAGLAFNYMFHFSRWAAAHKDNYQSEFTQVDTVKNRSSGYKSTDDQQVNTLALLKSLGNEVVGAAEGRLLMLELTKVVDASLPVEEGVEPGQVSKFALDSGRRPQIHVEHLEMQYKEDLTEWFTEDAKAQFVDGQVAAAPQRAPAPAEGEAQGEAPAAGELDAGATDAEAPTAAASAAEDSAEPQANGLAQDQDAGMLGGDEGEEDAGVEVDDSAISGRPGWVVELKAKHYHNSPHHPESMGAHYVRQTLLRNLQADRKIMLPDPTDPNNSMKEFTLAELGIHFPLIASQSGPSQKDVVNPHYTPPMLDFDDEAETSGRPTGRRPKQPKRPAEDKDNPKSFKVWTYEFTVQFCWIPTRISERLDARNAAEVQTGQGEL